MKRAVRTGPPSGGARQRQLGPGDGAFGQDLAAEAHELGRAAAGADLDLAGLLDQALRLDQAAEILLVQAAASERLDRALQVQQGEGGRQQLEHDRAIFDLGAQARDAGGEDAAMVMGHRLARHQPVGGNRAGACRLRHQAGLIEQLEALQHQILVPAALGGAEGHRGALQPLAAERRLARLLGPGGEPRQDQVGHQPVGPAAPILPRKIAVPVLPRRLRRGRTGFARQPQIAERYHPVAVARRAVAVGEGVELLDIAQRLVRLRLDPGAQAQFERAVILLQRPRRQRVVDHQHARLVRRDGDHDGAQFQPQRLGDRIDRGHRTLCLNTNGILAERLPETKQVGTPASVSLAPDLAQARDQDEGRAEEQHRAAPDPERQRRQDIAGDRDPDQEADRQRGIVDEQAEQFLDDRPHDRTAGRSRGLTICTSSAPSASQATIIAGIDQSSPGQARPSPSPVQNSPNDRIMVPTANLRVFSGTRASGRRSARPSASTTRNAATAPSVAGTKRPPAAPTAMTMKTTSRPSSSTALNAVISAAKSAAPCMAAVSLAKASVSSCSASRPAARRIALRSHRAPNRSSRTPTPSCRYRSGTSDSAGPRMTTSRESATTPRTAPVSAGRQPRTVPTASTIVSASTNSTREARNAASMGAVAWLQAKGKVVIPRL